MPWGTVLSTSVQQVQHVNCLYSSQIAQRHEPASYWTTTACNRRSHAQGSQPFIATWPCVTTRLTVICSASIGSADPVQVHCASLAEQYFAFQHPATLNRTYTDALQVGQEGTLRTAACCCQVELAWTALVLVTPLSTQAWGRFCVQHSNDCRFSVGLPMYTLGPP